MAQDLFEELQTNLDGFETYMSTHKEDIRNVYAALVNLAPQVETLVDSLRALLLEIKAAVNDLPENVTGIEDATEFAGKVKNLILAATPLFEGDPPPQMAQVIAAAEVIDGLPSIGSVKTKIEESIDNIIQYLIYVQTPVQ